MTPNQTNGGRLIPVPGAPTRFYEVCKHDIPAGQCLSVECLKFTNTPVRGEKSWDSALQPQNGGPFPNLLQLWQSHLASTSLKFTMTPTSVLTGWYSPLLSPSPSQPRPEPEATPRDMPVIGFRGWRVRMVEKKLSIGPRTAERQLETKEVELVSVNEQFGYWDRRGVTQAKCHLGLHHRAPGYHCECGLYVLTALVEAPKWYAEHGVPEDVVIGAVVGWGDVIQHGEEGWRAEFARPLAFLKTDVFYDQPLLYRVAKQYGVPVLQRRGLELYAKEYGASLGNLDHTEEISA